MRGSGAGECLRPVGRSRERGAAAHIRRRRAHIAHTRVAPYPLTSYRRALLVVPHYVDLHSHYLPALDDGATNLEMSLQMMPVAMENQLFEIRTSGYVPVMAHPERYVAVQRDPSLAERLGRHAAMLIDLGALDGAHGKAELKTARKLVLDGLVHGAASDIHRPEDQASVAAGMAWIKKQRGQAVLDQMLDENPRRLLAGELPDAPRA